MKISSPVRNSIHLVAAATLVFSICASPTQAHENSNFEFSNDGQRITIRGEGQDRRYEVDGKVFYWNDLNSSQQARITAIEKRLEAAEEQFDFDSDKLDHWADRMDQVADDMEEDMDDLEDIEDTFEDEMENVTLGELDRMAARLEKQAAEIEKRMAAHEQKFRQMESQMPEIEEAAIRQLDQETNNMVKALREIAEEI